MMLNIESLVNISNGAGKGALEAKLLKAFPDLVPALKVTRTRRDPKLGTIHADLAVEVVTPSGHKRWLFFEVKANPVPGLVRESLRRLKAELPKESSGYPMLAALFIGPRVREICLEEGAGYLDLAGNCYLRMDDFYIEKEVAKNPFPRRGRPASLFTPVSSRILRVLLEEPDRDWAVTQLSQTARVSLGQVSEVCRRLLQEGYAEKTPKRIRLTHPGKLLDAWRDGYLPAKNARLAYYSFDRNPQQIMAKAAATASSRRWNYAVTSFAGASLIAPFVRGISTVAWYVRDAAMVDFWVKAMDLRPVEAGPNALLLIPYDEGVFYKTQVVDGISVAGNIQLYLDLYNNPTRGREQAEFLRQEKIKF